MVVVVGVVAVDVAGVVDAAAAVAAVVVVVVVVDAHWAGTDLLMSHEQVTWPIARENIYLKVRIFIIIIIIISINILFITYCIPADSVPDHSSLNSGMVPFHRN